ncbi:MAG: hypothetical protein LBP56_09275 [Odoribacteraceae bacterium]|jgi:hypothetical protein|nr:hypothetical protein [Odoribacteraceae bacterium]
MKNDVLLDNLMIAIKEQLPEGKNLAATLADFLCIGREAAYRRLRGEVPFTFGEVTTIADKLNISLDAIVGKSREDTIPFYYTALSFADASDRNYELFKRDIEAYERSQQDPHSELGMAINMIPLTFVTKYSHLMRLRCYKWAYQHEGRENMIPYEKMILPDRFVRLGEAYSKAVEGIRATYIILDPMVFNYLISDITYFSDVGLILPGEVTRIKEELLLLLDDLERAAVNGRYDSGNALYLYISNTNFESTYSYTVYEHGSVSCLSIFTLNVLTSSDETMFCMVKEWVHSLKRLSTLISEAGEMPRRLFFRKQRELVHQLDHINT